MKKNIFILLFLCFICSFSQEKSSEEVIEELNEKINVSENEIKLKWMDSLSNYIAYETDFISDSITRKTIKYALELDSINIAIWHTAQQIYYLNNVKVQREEAINIFLESKKYIKRVNKWGVLSKYYYEIADTYAHLNEYERALTFYDSVYYYSKKENNNKFLSLSKMGKGQVYTDLGDLGKASLNLQDAIDIFRDQKDTINIIQSRNVLSILYSKNQFFKEAKQERDEIIVLATAKGLYERVAVYFFNASTDNLKMGNQKTRISNLKLALKNARLSKYPEFYEPFMLLGLVRAYAEVDSLSLANKYFVEIERNKKQNSVGPYKSYYLEAITSLTFAKKDYASAISYGEEYLDIMKEEKKYEEIEHGERFLYKVYQEIGNNDKAFYHYKNYKAINDSVTSVQKTRALSYYQTIYETEKRDFTIKAQQTDISLLESQNKVKNQWFLIGGILVFVFFSLLWLWRSRNDARKRQLQLEQFSSKLIKTQEIERTRIAKELHDSIGQKLLLLKNKFQLKKVLKENDITLVEDTIKEVREMSHNLYPFQFEKLGLTKSLELMVDSLQKNSAIFYSENIDDISGLLPMEKEIFVYRMLQECISNVEKHANATACNLSVKEEKKHVLFKLKDNGKGFDVNSKKKNLQGLGMKTLKERADYIGAYLEIDSVIGKGTNVFIKISKK